MSGVAWIPVACKIVSEYVPNDYRVGIYGGASAGACTAVFVLNYLSRFASASPKGKEEDVCEKNIVLISKGAFVTACAVTGGFIGFIPFIR